MKQKARLRAASLLAVSVLLVAALSGCKINKQTSGAEEHVNIQTPVGGLNVTTNTDANDTGLTIYPGAHLKPSKEHDKSSAKVNLATSFFGMKVVALTYQSDDAPQKVTDFYKKEMAKFGPVLECRTDRTPGRVVVHKGEGSEPKCDSSQHGDTLELKVGGSERQHVVSIKPEGSGTEFALVYVQLRGKEGTL
jgi:hypothetical protein